MTNYCSSICTRCNLLCEEPGDCHLVEDRKGDGEGFVTPTQTSRCFINQQQASEDASVSRAAELLKGARQPLVFGLSNHGVAVQRAAIALADHLRGIIDVEMCDAARIALMAEQQYGVLTATLGEIRQRADTLLLFNCDPETTHPRLLERSCARRTSTPTLCRITAQTGMMAPNDDWQSWSLAEDAQAELLRWLRTRGKSDEHTNGNVSHIWTEIVETLDHSRYCAVLWQPLPVANRAQSMVHATEFFRWLAAENTRRTVVAVQLGEHHVGTAEQVMTWQTGYPCSVSFLGGAPNYDPHRWVGSELMAQGTADVALLVGCNRLDAIRDTCPIISVDCHPDVAKRAAVVFETAAGQCDPDIYFRLDGIALQATYVGDAPGSNAATVLASLLDRLRG